MWSLTVSPQIINSPSLEKARPNVHSTNESRQGTFGWSRYALVICYRDQNKCRSHLMIRSSKPPNRKGWETLRCGLEQYFDLAQLLICRWEGKGRTPPVIYVALLNRSNPFEVKAIWGANQLTHDTSAAFFWICLKMDSEMWKARWRQAKYNSHICTSFWEWLCYDKCCSDHQPNAISSLARELTVN